MQIDIMMNLIFKNCKIVDGTGNPWYRGDVGIVGNKISKIGNLSSFQAEEIVEGNELILSPGFIDMHSHSDLVILKEPWAMQKIKQGVTTELLGQDGTSIAPVKPEHKRALRRQVSGLLGDPDIEWNWTTYEDYFKILEQLGTTVNMCSLVPYGQLRTWAMGMDNRKSTEEELKLMQEKCREAFEHGAVGISLGLIYPPCVYAEPKEIVEVCKVASECGGFLVCHIRNESDKLIEAIDEIIDISKRARIPLHVSHLKTSGKNNWHKGKALLSKLEEAREVLGVEITFDQYPYIAASTMLSALIPPWAHAGGVKELLGRLKKEETATRIKKEILSDDASSWENWVKNCGWDGIVVTSVKSQNNKEVEGKNFVEIGKKMGLEPIDAVFKLLIEEETAVSMVMFWGDEEGVKEIMKHPYYTAGSDGLLGGKPHPRVYGTFARVLGKYSRDEKLFALEEAVRHITSLPAQRLSIQDRGIIKEGMVADLVLFDANTIIDTATYVEPDQYPKGIHYVVVNGTIVIRRGEHTGARPGLVLRKSI